MFRIVAFKKKIKGKIKEPSQFLGHTGTVGPQTSFEMTIVSRYPGTRFVVGRILGFIIRARHHQTLLGEHFQGTPCILYPLAFSLSNQGCNKTGLGRFTENECEDILIKLKAGYKWKVLSPVAALPREGS